MMSRINTAVETLGKLFEDTLENWKGTESVDVVTLGLAQSDGSLYVEVEVDGFEVIPFTIRFHQTSPRWKSSEI